MTDKVKQPPRSMEMDDEAFDELKLKMIIAPHSAQWPNETVHWRALREAIDEARSRVSGAYSLMAEIDADPDLSKEGKQRKRERTAAAALDEFQTSTTLNRARSAVERQTLLWDEKVGLTVKPPSNIHEATVHAQIRDRLFGTKDRMSFLEQNGSDPMIASAVLTAPKFLSGVSDAELKMLHHKIETHVSPEIAEARAATLKAMKEAEQGWQKAIDKIGERAGLAKGP